VKRFKAYVRTEQGKFSQYTGAERVSSDTDKPSSRFVGTKSLTDIYKSMTPGYDTSESPESVPGPETEQGK
jgi:hypothetical protein